ncbi:50S ribosomal protein L15 [Vitis vinifera]|uniref:50S ribosomal protein L15 n=1 Tax=Vitis vinifera TaxID=29760 RepID=A0A438BN30_VITVI|nr:50S ribosomal protein L15 [Vitis vinifera]
MLRRRLPSLLSTSLFNASPIVSSKCVGTKFPLSSPFLPLHSLQCANPSPTLKGIWAVDRVRAYSLLSLNDLRDNKGARKQKKRKGRGIGSGLGKTAGRVTRMIKSLFYSLWQPVGLGKIAKLINAGKIDSSELITMKTLKDAGAIGKQIKDGVRLMGRGADEIKWPIHFEVSRVTVRAKEAVEAAGGSVRRVYYNKLGFQALLKPEWFEKKGRLLPKAARPPPKQRDKVDSIGRLPAPTKPIPFLPEEKEAAFTPSV